MKKGIFILSIISIGFLLVVIVKGVMSLFVGGEYPWVLFWVATLFSMATIVTVAIDLLKSDKKWKQ